MTAHSLYVGDCLSVLPTLEAGSVQACVTSPPYFGLRDYGVAGQMGLERTPEEYVAKLVAVFREVRRVLRDDGTLWLNLGDSYAASGRGGNPIDSPHQKQRTNRGSVLPAGLHESARQAGQVGRAWVKAPPGYKAKDLVGIPWMAAFALRASYYTGTIRDERDRIWLAAMLDAEGCIYIHRRKEGQNNGQGYTRKNDSYGAGMEIANTHETVVQRCMEITQRGSIFRQDKDRRQLLWRWTLRTNECRDVIRELYPYLVAKQHQARIVLGCPSSGTVATAAWEGLKLLHAGSETTSDFPPPRPMYEPGFYLRSDVIWSKANPMPESVTDRPTKAHEYLFLLAKSERYYYDADAISEPATHAGKVVRTNGNEGMDAGYDGHRTRDAFRRGVTVGANRNRRSVWTVATRPFADAHFATFPPKLIEPCILAGSRRGDTVLDPFGGAGTTGLVADRLGRHSVLIELNPAYAAMARERIDSDCPLFNDIADGVA